MSKTLKVLFAAMLVLLLTLTACGGKDNNEDKGGNNDNNNETADNNNDGNEDDDLVLYDINDFSQYTSNEGDVIDGGHITFGLVSDTAFEGTLNWNFYSGNPDAQILGWFDESLLTWDANYVYTNDGAATYETNEEGNIFTFTIRDNVNWHDGTPVTAEDWLFAHEVIAHPEYDGVRFDSSLRNIVGIEEYHKGEADTISGITVLNDKQLQIEYIDVTPSLVTGGVWTYPLAKHIFGDMEVAEMSSSPEVRQHPIGFGPFKVDVIVPGESVTMVKNEDYWRGEPKLDGVTVKVINPNTVVQELKTGGVDLVSSFPVDQFPDNADLSNLEWLGTVDRAYTYIGFKLGNWDAENKRVNMDPTKKMADVNLRKAMWHAVDNDLVGKRFYHGLRWNATTLIPPSHPEFHDETNPGLTYDLEKAKQILADAGYKDIDGDNFVETPDGEKLVINFISMTGGDVAEPLARYYVQQWNEIGLNVELEMVEFNTFYDRVGQFGEDDPNVDVYQGAWGVGIDVDPRGLYGPDAMFNFPRYENEKNSELLAKGVSQEAFDVEYRKEVYKEWQQFMVEEVPVFPTLYRSNLVPVNKRIHNFAVGDGTGVYRYEIAVSQDKPFVAE